MNPKECSFCGQQIELGNEEDDYYLWTQPNMSFEDGQLACLDCVRGSAGAQHDLLHGPGER